MFGLFCVLSLPSFVLRCVVIVNATRYPPRPDRRLLAGSDWREHDNGKNNAKGRKGASKHWRLLSTVAAHSTREVLLWLWFR